MKYDAMILIDMQTALLDAHPYNEVQVIKNIKNILSICRANKIPVIFIRHDGGYGDELEQGCSGWQICEELTPLPEEKIINKQYNSAFRETGLREYLDNMKVKHIILCGMQTEYCFDVTCKVAFEYGYQVTIPQNTTTTYDNALASGKDLSEYFENKIWNNRYAKVVPVEQIISELENEQVK